VVKEQILVFSPGFVEEFEKIKEGKNDDGLYEVTIRATVKRWQIVERVENLLNTSGYTGKFDGKSLWANIQSKLDAGQKGAALLKKALKDLNLPYSLLKAEPVNDESKLLKQGADATQYEWKIRVQYDQEKYQKVVLPKLKQVLDDIAMAKIEKPVRHNVKDNKWGTWSRANAGWNRIGVYDYLFDVHASPQGIVFDRPLPKVSKVPDARPGARGGSTPPPTIQGKNKPVAGGIPVFLLEDWQPATGQQTYRVYWVNLECAIVLKEYFSAASALKLDLRDKDKRVLFTETIHFWGNWNRDGGIEMLGLIGKKELKANVLQPTLIYGGRSEFIDEKSLMDIKANAKYIQFGGFTLRPAETRAETLELFRSKLPRHVNTISIMPLMHLQQSRVSRSRGGVTEVAYHPWQPEIPNEIAKNIEQITCEIVNFGKQ